MLESSKELRCRLCSEGSSRRKWDENQNTVYLVPTKSCWEQKKLGWLPMPGDPALVNTPAWPDAIACRGWIKCIHVHMFNERWLKPTGTFFSISQQSPKYMINGGLRQPGTWLFLQYVQLKSEIEYCCALGGLCLFQLMPTPVILFPRGWLLRLQSRASKLH